MALKIEDCPKKMKNCVTTMCPMFDNCWAYEKYMREQKKNNSNRDSGWE